MSDPVPLDGNEVFDPGDTYPWYGSALSFPGADGVRDDALAFTADFWPDPNPAPPFTADDTRAETRPLPRKTGRFRSSWTAPRARSRISTRQHRCR